MKTNFKTLAFFTVLLFLTGCGAATKLTGGSADTKPQIGDTVVFKVGPINYSEGKVEKIDGGKYEIRSADNIAKADTADVYALPKAGAKADVKAGDFVIAFTREIYWVGGEVTNVSGDLVEIEQASGGKLNVAPDKILKVSSAAIADIKQNVEQKAFEDLGKTKKPLLPKAWKPKKGDKVAAQWSFGNWYAAIVKNVNANNIDIDWQNGWSDGTVGTDKVAPMPTASDSAPKIGDYVILKPTSDTQEWRFATVTTVNGQDAEVKTADGKTQKLRVGDFISMS
ncbi:MAG TPA: hypothetical protein VGC76_18615 [Pyrinomonadaceae bacterium]|jgi:hypothetical protein